MADPNRILIFVRQTTTRTMKRNKKKQIPTEQQLKEYPQLKNWIGITTLEEAIWNIVCGIDPDLPF